jgi:hypothetical protein
MWKNRVDARVGGRGAMHRLTGGIVAAVAALAVASSASAGSPRATSDAADLVVPADTVVSGAAADDAIELTKVSVGPLAGRSCDVRSVRSGDGPVHIGNDLVVRSGASEVLLPDVEREIGVVTEGADPIELDRILVIELMVGRDAAYAGDLVVELDCRPLVSSFASPAGAGDDGGDRGRSALPLAGADIAPLAFVAGGLIVVGALVAAAARRRGHPPTAVG